VQAGVVVGGRGLGGVAGGAPDCGALLGFTRFVCLCCTAALNGANYSFIMTPLHGSVISKHVLFGGHPMPLILFGGPHGQLSISPSLISLNKLT